MASITWLTVLTNELAMADRFTVELDRQLRAQDRSLAGIDLADGYALLPPNDGFAVRFKTAGPAVLGVIEGYLVDPVAHGHPVALGWRSRTAPDRRVEPSDDVIDVEFAWLEFPIAELSARASADTSVAEGAVLARFPVEWNVDDWTSTRLRWRARRPFSADEEADLTTTLSAAVRAWNARAPGKIHHVGQPEVAPDRSEIAFYVDLGAAGADAVVALINAVATSPVADVVASAAVGRRS